MSSAERTAIPITACEKGRIEERAAEARRRRAQLHKLAGELDLTRAQRDVLKWMIDHWLRHRHTKGGVIHPGKPAIQAALGYSDKTVRDALHLFEALHILTAVGARRGGKRVATEYTFDPLALHSQARGRMEKTAATGRKSSRYHDAAKGELSRKKVRPEEVLVARHRTPEGASRVAPPSASDDGRAPSLLEQAHGAYIPRARSSRRAGAA